MSKEPIHMPYDEFASNLENLFERVAAKKETIVVEKANGTRAVLKPAPATKVARRAKTADREAFRRAFGAWQDIVDADTLKKDLAAGRGSRRRPVRL